MKKAIITALFALAIQAQSAPTPTPVPPVITSPTPSLSPPPSVPALLRVKLAWDASASSGVTDYRVYWGTATDTFTSWVDLGKTLTADIGVPPHATYYFVVTAIATNLQSNPSNEVSVTEP